ncbi:hypothetical protein ACRAWD_00840 [Caulobacter segnis]
MQVDFSASYYLNEHMTLTAAGQNLFNKKEEGLQEHPGLWQETGVVSAPATRSASPTRCSRRPSVAAATATPSPAPRPSRPAWQPRDGCSFAAIGSRP